MSTWVGPRCDWSVTKGVGGLSHEVAKVLNTVKLVNKLGRV